MSQRQTHRKTRSPSPSAETALNGDSTDELRRISATTDGGRSGEIHRYAGSAIANKIQAFDAIRLTGLTAINATAAIQSITAAKAFIKTARPRHMPAAIFIQNLP